MLQFRRLVPSASLPFRVCCPPSVRRSVYLPHLPTVRAFISGHSPTSDQSPPAADTMRSSGTLLICLLALGAAAADGAGTSRLQSTEGASDRDTEPHAPAVARSGRVGAFLWNKRSPYYIYRNRTTTEKATTGTQYANKTITEEKHNRTQTRYGEPEAPDEEPQGPDGDRQARYNKPQARALEPQARAAEPQGPVGEPQARFSLFDSVRRGSGLQQLTRVLVDLHQSLEGRLELSIELMERLLERQAQRTEDVSAIGEALPLHPSAAPAPAPGPPGPPGGGSTY